MLFPLATGIVTVLRTALLATLLALPQAAKAQVSIFVCAPVAEVEARAEQMRAARQVTIRRFDGDEATAFLEVVNLGSKTMWKGKSVILARFPDGTGTIALLDGEKGCMASFLLPEELLTRAVAAAGVRA